MAMKAAIDRDRQQLGDLTWHLDRRTSSTSRPPHRRRQLHGRSLALLPMLMDVTKTFDKN